MPESVMTEEWIGWPKNVPARTKDVLKKEFLILELERYLNKPLNVAIQKLIRKSRVCTKRGKIG